jgi:hypothetical protein
MDVESFCEALEIPGMVLMGKGSSRSQDMAPIDLRYYAQAYERMTGRTRTIAYVHRSHDYP